MLITEKKISSSPEWVDKLLESIMNGDPLFELIDLFCGAGGLTEGAEQAEWNGVKLVDVIACVNHDAAAIKSHLANHSNCLHFTEDIRKLNVKDLPLKKLGKFLILHASLECTNFSNAKGGQPRDADSRTLAEDLYRYVDHLNPDYITIENVREFMAWGPLDTNGKPISRDKGKDYLAWVEAMKSRGYEYEFRLLNAADFGAYTSRIRYFGVFAKKGLPIVWPQPTHAKNPANDSGLLKWKAVRDVLELQEKGVSIFERKKDLSENTLKRIYAGLVKYVAKGDDSFIKKYFSGRPMGKVISTDQPAGTITTIDHQTLVQPQFLQRYYSGNPEHRNHPIDQPAGTVRTNNCMALVSPEFMVKYYGTALAAALENISPTLTTKDRLALINCQWLDKQYHGQHNHQSINVPAGSVTTVPKMNVVQLDTIVSANPENNGEQYLMNPQFQSNGKDLDSPCFTIIARLDKKPPYLVSSEEGAGFVIIYDSDNETMKKIKVFMAEYGIIDIKMRMLLIKELKRIQGFPEDYILEGTKTNQKKFIGNAVVPVIPKVWYSALGKVLLEKYAHYIKYAA